MKTKCWRSGFGGRAFIRRHQIRKTGIAGAGRSAVRERPHNVVCRERSNQREEEISMATASPRSNVKALSRCAAHARRNVMLNKTWAFGFALALAAAPVSVSLAAGGGGNGSAASGAAGTGMSTGPSSASGATGSAASSTSPGSSQTTQMNATGSTMGSPGSSGMGTSGTGGGVGSQSSNMSTAPSTPSYQGSNTTASNDNGAAAGTSTGPASASK
jgi:hypothetical protein